MLKDDFFELGVLSRKHGFKGGLIAKIDTDFPERYENLESVFLETDGTLVPFFIADCQLLPSGTLRIQFEGIQTEQDAERLLGTKLFLPIAALPKLSGKQFYFHEVVNYGVIDATHGPIGLIKLVLDRPPQPVFVIQNLDKEILIPAVDEFIVRIDREEKNIYLHTPEGLIDLYL
jgi:16S rRNA processing protein RimM